MNAWADGLNYYLHKHPQVKPRVIKRFEPWMALTFSEGSIGGDIEKVNLTQLEAFYGKVRRRHAHRGRLRAVALRRAGADESLRRADRIERHRHRAVEHGRDITRCC